MRPDGLIVEGPGKGKKRREPNTYLDTENGKGTVGALIGWIGDDRDESFFIGQGKKLIVEQSGNLHLAVNDTKGDYYDNLDQYDKPRCFIVCVEVGYSAEPEMVLIPAGEFLMGEDLKTVSLPDYYIAKTPITNAQYRPFVQAGGICPEYWRDGQPPAGKVHHPVVDVSWNDAVTFCDWLAEVTGKPYRLPTEQEWEKAARGTDAHKYPWGDEPPSENLCNFDKNMGGTTPAGRYSPQGDSLFGCVDMAGNVYEWTMSWYDKDKTGRVLRGGSWCNSHIPALCSYRERGDTGHGLFGNLGFRVCFTSHQEKM